MSPSRSPRYRRSPHLVVHWRDGNLIIESYAGAVATQIEATPLVLDVLDRFTAWEPIDTIARQLPKVPRHLLETLIAALVEHGALQTPERQTSPWDAWKAWSPAASFFHRSTKDVAFTPRDETNQRLKARAVHDPIPSPLKPPYRGKRIALPAPTFRAASESLGRARPAAAKLSSSTLAGAIRAGRVDDQAIGDDETDVVRASPIEPMFRTAGESRGRARPTAATLPSSALAGAAGPISKKSGALPVLGFPDVLLSRRTWRRFGRRSLRLDELGTLLGLTWGVQAWMEVEGWGRMALKTAPSGGARHSIEAYVLVRRVSRIEPGLYHYQPASHALHAIAPMTTRAARAAILAYLPRQTFYGDASAVVLMSAVFARVQWRYAFARAYRTVLAEAGHHCQTFCLTATWLGLAPFCTMALADSRIERDLRIDGVGESVLYAAGVGPRPSGTSWAPWGRTTATPTRTPNPLGRAGSSTNNTNKPRSLSATSTQTRMAQARTLRPVEPRGTRKR